MIGETVARVQDRFNKSGFMETANHLKQHLQGILSVNQQSAEKTGKRILPRKDPKDDSSISNLDAQSEITIY